MSLLELMSHSHLWQELRGVAPSLAPQSMIGLQNEDVRLNSYTFDTLPFPVQDLMKEYVLRVLDVETLSSYDVVRLGQSLNIASLPQQLQNIPAYCTDNVIVTTLSELVKMGKVECIQKIGSSWSDIATSYSTKRCSHVNEKAIQ
jgi:hypothetical protein